MPGHSVMTSGIRGLTTAALTIFKTAAEYCPRSLWGASDFPGDGRDIAICH
jgi:hypothetical protein